MGSKRRKCEDMQIRSFSGDLTGRLFAHRQGVKSGSQFGVHKKKKKTLYLGSCVKTLRRSRAGYAAYFGRSAPGLLRIVEYCCVFGSFAYLRIPFFPNPASVLYDFDDFTTLKIGGDKKRETTFPTFPTRLYLRHGYRFFEI
jgi:hypothetical protein